MNPDIGNLSDEQFSTIVRYAPLISIDLIIRDLERYVLLALRNEPAKGYYFVPGGRIRKGETIQAAFSRILMTETGLDIRFSAACLLGAFQHIYSTNRFCDTEYGTHYVVLAYQISVGQRPVIRLDDQHASCKWVDERELKAAPDVHEYVKAYFGG
jgi:colanic acid biosynthesis protein WcaH